MTKIDYNQLRVAIQAMDTAGENWRDHFWEQAAHDNQQVLPAAVTNKLLKQGLNHSEMQILSRVTEHADKSLAYQELVQIIPFSQGMVSRYVKKLVTADLLIRYHQAENHKAVFLKITPTGELLAKMHTAMHVAENAHYTKILQQFDQAELATTLKVLRAWTE